MILFIYNTQSRKNEVFRPVNEGRVAMYVCGPTVYDLLHVGNFRGAIFFNLVRGWLERLGYKVTFVYNYTDVDDKIIQKAAKEGMSADEVSKKYIAEFEKDFRSLGLRAHDHNPRVTGYMDRIVAFCEELLRRGHAYEAGGEIIFSIDSFPAYGNLSGRNLEDLRAGHRVEADAKKKNPLDFVLWKPSKPGEPGWNSPWGTGRPGWHIECSAMARDLLGDSIDIHGGGVDLVFPHHENEAAQSEAATGRPFVRYWMHNAFIQFGENKMSKSLGNVWTGRAFLEEYGPEILKYMMLSAHYRSPITFNEQQVYQAMEALGRIYSALAAARAVAKKGKPDPGFEKHLKDAGREIADGLNDDFNTPVMFAQIFKVVRAFNALMAPGSKAGSSLGPDARVFCDWVKDYGKLLSLFQEEPAGFLKDIDDLLLARKQLTRKDVDRLVRARTEARGRKDFGEADRIRGELSAMGIELRDTAKDTAWEVRKE